MYLNIMAHPKHLNLKNMNKVTAHLTCFFRNGISTETEPPFPQSFSDDSDESGEPVTLRPNRFRPDAGTRNRLRNRLHEVLENSEDSNTDPSSDERTSTRYSSP